MGIFLITPEILEAVRVCRAYSEDKEHWYHPGPNAVIPGDVPQHVVVSGSIRTVFSWSAVRKDVYRHLSVSTSTPGRYPLPIVVYTLADLFGFTGGGSKDEHDFVHQPSKEWMMQADHISECIVVSQKVSGGAA